MGVQAMNHVVHRDVVVKQDTCHVLSFVPVMENQDARIPTISTVQGRLMKKMTTNAMNWMKITCLWTNYYVMPHTFKIIIHMNRRLTANEQKPFIFAKAMSCNLIPFRIITEI